MTTSRGIQWTRRAFTAGQIVLILGLCFYSLMTTTPLVAEHSQWAWSGWALGAMADAAFIMAITADSTLARHGVTVPGGWVRSFKWFTGLSVVYLNIWTAVEARDAVGVAIHIIAPALVMLLAEVGPIYTAALASAEKAAGAPQSDYYSGDHPMPHVPGAEPVEGRMEVPRVPLSFAEMYGTGRREADDYFAQERAGMQEYRERSAEAVRRHMETIDGAVSAEEFAEATQRAVDDMNKSISDLDGLVPTPRAEEIDVSTYGSEETITVPAVSDAESGAALLGSVEDVADALGMSLEEPKKRMSNSEANELIEQGWRHGIDPKVVATSTGRHVQTVRRKYREHEEQSASNAA